MPGLRGVFTAGITPGLSGSFGAGRYEGIGNRLPYHVKLHALATDDERHRH